MNPNLLLDPLLCETVEARQRGLLEAARIAERVTGAWRSPPPILLRVVARPAFRFLRRYSNVAKYKFSVE